MNNFEEITKRINNEMELISKAMYAVVNKYHSTAAFVQEMYNKHNIICL